MKVACLYLSEGYECYHIAAVSAHLARYDGVKVTEFYLSPTIPGLLQTLRSRLDHHDLPLEQLIVTPVDRLLSSFRNVNTLRRRVLNRYRTLFEQYDILISSEYIAGQLKKDGLIKPRLVWLSHGAGNRLVKRDYLARQFDFLLLFGPRHERELLTRHLASHHNSRIVGYPKFDTCAALPDRTPPRFKNDKPFILYNPHYKRSLNSYPSCVRALTRHIEEQDDYNLVIAPHMDFFATNTCYRTRAFTALRSDKIHPDSGSTAMMDMTYTDYASLYIGDASSQVYEFLQKPRPCIFLNPHGVDWQDDPAFAHWHAGEVVENPAHIGRAIARAHAQHSKFLPVQRRLIRDTFGHLPHAGAAQRAAQAIRDYGKLLSHV